MENTIRERLIEFIKYKQITTRMFERSIDVSNGYVSKITGTIGADKLHRISVEYPQLNIEWLMTGEGDMLNNVVTPREPEIIELDGGGFAKLLRVVEDHDIRFHELADRILDAMGAPRKKDKEAAS